MLSQLFAQGGVICSNQFSVQGNWNLEVNWDVEGRRGDYGWADLLKVRRDWWSVLSTGMEDKTKVCMGEEREGEDVGIIREKG